MKSEKPPGAPDGFFIECFYALDVSVPPCLCGIDTSQINRKLNHMMHRLFGETEAKNLFQRKP